MKRVVKPSGTLGTYMWDFLSNGYTQQPQQPLREAIEAMGIAVPVMPGHFNSGLENLKGFFEAARLDRVTARTIESEVSYADFDEYCTAETALSNSIVQHIRKMRKRESEASRLLFVSTCPRSEWAHHL